MYILFFFKHAWILFIAIAFINELIIRKKAKSYIEANPGVKASYHKFLKKYLLYSNIPWIIIGIGDITGMTKYIFDFFFPAQLNPIVLVFHFSVAILWGISIYWVYFNNGAEFLATHPNRFNSGQPNGIKDINKIKILIALMLLGGIAAEIIMWKHGGSPPNFHIDNGS